jgi:hypothetical protein
VFKNQEEQKLGKPKMTELKRPKLMEIFSKFLRY